MAKRTSLKVMTVMILAVLVGSSAWATLTDGLVSHWKLDGNATDSAGGNNGTIYGATPATGQIDGALEFDGTNDYVNLGNPASLNFSGAITISAWIKPDVINGVNINRNIVAHGYQSAGIDKEVYLRIANDGQYEIGSYVQGGGTGRATYTIPSEDQGNWVHLVGLYNGSTWLLYRNGTQVGSANNATGAIAVDENWAIGARGTGTERFFDGSIDDVRIYNRALSSEEVVQLYHIPEPATLLLFGLGGLALRFKRKQPLK